ncbi:MAG TPA: NB-ARC domain-containing protein, partial [Candidatus Sumerlaeota bacterium]|nr:NB-ARC domain-containing protein [Candidatus Sumerlaeota bacterium]
GDNEPFVERLHDDLAAAGFTVWFDRKSLLSRGLTFHQEIKDAIRAEVDRVVYVGGPKAVASLFVREEWKSALEYDHVVVTPILRLGDYDTCVPGELALLHCEDFRDDANYPRTLAKLIASLRQPNPKLGALYAVPNLPPNFLGRPDLMRRVRDALLVDLQKPQVITSADAKVGVQGMGGIGKSVLAAALARNRDIRRSYPDGVVWIACGQHLGENDLVSRMRDLARHLGGDEHFESISQGQGTLGLLLKTKSILLILDDIWSARDAKVFDLLGPRCRMLVTTRDAGILHTLDGEIVPVSLFTEAESLQLLTDAIATRERPVTVAELPDEAREVARKCGCLPLALALCGGMANKHGGDFRSVLERLRRADLDKIADRHTINPQHESIWRAMQASVEMLTEDEQHRFAELAVFDTDAIVPEAAVATLWAHTGHLDDLDAEDLLIALFERSLVQLDSKTDAEGRVQRRFRLHDLLYDFATRMVGDKQALHNTLLAAYRAKCPHGWASGPDDGHFLQQLGGHLAEAGQWDELETLLTDLAFLEAKVAAGLTFELPGNLRKAIDALPEERLIRGILKLLDEAICRDIYFIARHATDYPQALFQCVWNNGWWYDHPSAGNYYIEPESGFKASAPWQTPEPKLYELLERWRREHNNRGRVSPWLRSLVPPEMNLGTGQRAIFHGHTDRINSVAYSPDGKRIISGSRDKTLRVWDASSGLELLRIEGRTQEINSVAFSPDGRRVVSGSKDETLRVWDVKNGDENLVLRGHESRVNSVAFSPDGCRITSGSGDFEGEDNAVRVWDAKSGSEIAVLCGHGEQVCCVSFNPDGERIVSASVDGTIRIWNVVAGVEDLRLEGHQGAVTCASFSPDGSRVVSSGGFKDHTLRIWDASSGGELIKIKGHSDEVNSVAFSPDGCRIVSASKDKTVRVWDAASGKELYRHEGHTDTVLCAVFSPDGSRIVSGSGDGTIRMWEGAPESRHRLKGHEDMVASIAFSPNGNRIASGSRDGTIVVWDTASGVPLHLLKGHRLKVNIIIFSPDSSWIVSGSDDGTIMVWNAATGVLKHRLEGHERGVLSAMFSSDGALIVSGSGDNTVRVWETSSGNQLHCLEGHTDAVNSVAYSPDGALLVSGSGDNTVRVWNAFSGKQKHCIRGHTDHVTCVVFTSDGTRIASGSRDNTVRIWDAASGALLHACDGSEGTIWNVAFSQDGDRIAGGSEDKTVRIWNTRTGKCIEVIEGTGDSAAIAAGAHFHPLQVLGREGETVIRDAVTGKPLAFHSTGMQNIVTHPEGKIWAGDSNTSHLALILFEDSHPGESDSS